MLDLIKSLWEKNPEEVVRKSYLNCHSEGLHSVMLSSNTRLFFATKEHRLWQNYKGLYGQVPLSVAFHPHHCDITLHCIKGEFTDWQIEEGSDYRLDKYLFTSHIRTGEEAKFQVVDYKPHDFQTSSYETFSEGMSIRLPAKVLHTIACPIEKEVAWLITEGAEDPDYKPICYSNTPLDTMDFGRLYQPATYDDIVWIMRSIGIN